MSKLLSRVFIPLILFTVLNGCTAVPMVSPDVTPVRLHPQMPQQFLPLSPKQRSQQKHQMPNRNSNDCGLPTKAPLPCIIWS